MLVSLGLTVAVGAVLARRSAEHQARHSLDRQADLLAVQERTAPATPARLATLGVFLATQQQRLSIVTREQAALLLPQAATEIRSGRPADGTITIRGTRFLYAVRVAGPRAIVLLRGAKFEAADWRPFLWGLLLAGLAGAALAAVLSLFLARALARPVAAVAEAAGELAAGAHPEPIEASGPRETVALARAFNAMADALARARAAEKSFLLSVSHELKTPLTIISGNAEGLRVGVIAAETAGEAVEREAERLRRLIQDLLDLARLDQRTFSVRDSTVDLGKVAREAVERYRPQAERLGISLRLDGADDGATARGDSERLLQVLANLIENALNSGSAGDSVVVSHAPGELVVADTGAGIDPAELPRAFERFYLHRRHGDGARVGTGLGLAIVKELTEAMGGTVGVTSRPGAGTTFTVTLPPAGNGADATA
jgi:two-component system sensor histidine kinase BaeS